MKNGTGKDILIIGCGVMIGSLAASGIKLFGKYIAAKIAMKRMLQGFKDGGED